MSNMLHVLQAKPADATRGLHRRLQLAYALFTSATLAVLVAAFMVILYLSQLDKQGLYHIAYTEQISLIPGQVATFQAQYSRGGAQPGEVDAWVRALADQRGMFTSDAYVEFAAADGILQGASHRPLPKWVSAWPVAPNMREHGSYVLDGGPPIAVDIANRRFVESNNAVKNSAGKPIGNLKLRYRIRNMELLYIAAGTAIWLTLSFIALMLGALFGRWAARPLSQRLAVISTTSERWAQGDFSPRLQDVRKDEIGHLSARLNTMSEQLQSLLASRQALAASDERQRLARELHDSVKQQVFATSMQLGAVATALPADATVAQKLLGDAQITIQATHAELAAMIFALRPAALQQRGLEKALGDLIEGWRVRENVTLNLSITGACAVPLDVEHALFRVAQEALANAIRHSTARNITLTLRCDPAAVMLALRDDGAGFDADAAHSGLGLSSMRARMQDIGGTLTIHSAPNDGAEIVAAWSRNAAHSPENPL